MSLSHACISLSDLVEGVRRGLQARDEYYSGTPLILDDMFDKIEVRHSEGSGSTSNAHTCFPRLRVYTAGVSLSSMW